MDGAGNVYVTDSSNHRVQKFTPEGRFLAKWGIFGTKDGEFWLPKGIAVDGEGNVYIADSSTERIRKIGVDGIITTVAGNGEESFSGDGGAATEAALDDPTSVAVDVTGTIYFTDSGNQRIRRVTTGGIIETVAGGGTDFVGEEEVPALEARFG